MSSIAYISNEEMIEYHRLNKNTTINFWRLGNSRKIARFHVGDLLFFLTKGTEKGKEKEKGIVGYGRLQKSADLSIHQMWKQYETRNGYASKERFMEEIILLTKDHKIPKKMNCLLLDHVVFFQAPVYLSEIGVSISNKMESYTYIDKEELSNTAKILRVAASVGIDLWSAENVLSQQWQLERDAIYAFLKNISHKWKDTYDTPYDKKQLTRYLHGIETTGTYEKLAGPEYLKEENHIVTIYFPCLLHTKDLMKKIWYTVGRYQMYWAYLQKEQMTQVRLILLCDEELPQDVESLLSALSLSVEVRKGKTA